MAPGIVTVKGVSSRSIKGRRWITPVCAAWSREKPGQASLQGVGRHIGEGRGPGSRAFLPWPRRARFGGAKGPSAISASCAR